MFIISATVSWVSWGGL